jgi:hypothetical protein
MSDIKNFSQRLDNCGSWLNSPHKAVAFVSGAGPIVSSQTIGNGRWM